VALLLSAAEGRLFPCTIGVNRSLDEISEFLSPPFLAMVFGLIFFIDVLLLVVLAVGEFATGELKGDIMLIIEVAKDINSGAGTEIIDWFSSLASLTLIGVLL